MNNLFVRREFHRCLSNDKLQLRLMIYYKIKHFYQHFSRSKTIHMNILLNVLKNMYVGVEKIKLCHDL